MKNLIYFNESAYNTFVREFVAPTATLQSLVTSFNTLDIGTLATADLQGLFTDEYEAVIFDKITAGQDLTLNGIKLDKAKALPLIQKPDGYDAFIQNLTSAKTSFGYTTAGQANQFKQFMAISNYIIDGSGNVAVSPAFLTAQQNNNFSYYTTSADQVTYLNALNAFITALQTLVNNGMWYSKGKTFVEIDDFVYFNTTTKVFSIKYPELSSYFRNNTFFS